MARLVLLDSIGSLALRLPNHDKSRPKDRKMSDSWIRHAPSAWTSQPSAAQYGTTCPAFWVPFRRPLPLTQQGFQLQAAFRPVFARHSRLTGRAVDYT